MSCRVVDDRTLIIGYGNPLRSDDAAGLHVARLLAAEGYQTIETFQLVPEIAEQIADRSQVIFVDCDVTLAPGQVAVNALEPGDAARTALHDPASPPMLLKLARDLYAAQPAAFLVGIGPSSLEFDESLSAFVEQAIPIAADAIRRLVSLETQTASPDC